MTPLQIGIGFLLMALGAIYDLRQFRRVRELDATRAAVYAAIADIPPDPPSVVHLAPATVTQLVALVERGNYVGVVTRHGTAVVHGQAGPERRH